MIKNTKIFGITLIAGAVAVVAGIAAFEFWGAGEENGFFSVSQKQAAEVDKNTSVKDAKNKESDSARLKNASLSKPANEDRIMKKEGFSIKVPAGWIETKPMAGVTAIIANPDESYANPALQKTGFRSYFSVSRNEAGEKNWEQILDQVYSVVKSSAPGINFSSETEGEKNGLKTHTAEADFRRSDGGEFKILLFVAEGRRNDFWILTFNTGKEKWNKYSHLAPEVFNSFTSQK